MQTIMKDAARVDAKRVVVAEERGCRCGGIFVGVRVRDSAGEGLKQRCYML